MHDFPPTCLAFSPDSRIIASGSADSSIRTSLLPPGLIPKHSALVHAVLTSAISDELLFVVFVILVLAAAVVIMVAIEEF